MKFIYVTGKLKGLTDKEAFEKFNEATERYKTDDNMVITPLAFITAQGVKTERGKLFARIEGVSVCHEVIMLPDYKEDSVCEIELRVAQELNISVRYGEDN